MIKTDELANPESCLNKADSNEPLFVLRAHDPIASYIVNNWAAHYFNRKGGHSQMTERERAKYREARAIAKAMDEWRKNQPLSAV